MRQVGRSVSRVSSVTTSLSFLRQDPTGNSRTSLIERGNLVSIAIDSYRHLLCLGGRSAPRLYSTMSAQDVVRRQDFKVVILGASGVGKTCLGLRFVKDQFVTYTASTIGASFLVKELVFNNQKVTLQIWDTAGQERFRSMAPLYYRGAVAAILVFSITDENSFEKLKEWVSELQNNVDDPLVLAIACNKADLTDQRVVSMETASQYANSIGALICETSAKSNTGTLQNNFCQNCFLQPEISYSDTPCLPVGVTQLFHEVARSLIATKMCSSDSTPATSSTQLPDPLRDPALTQRSRCC